MKTDLPRGPITIIALVALAPAFCLLPSYGSKDAGDDPAASGSGIWARSLAAASSSSSFEKAASDSSGNIFAVGRIDIDGLGSVYAAGSQTGNGAFAYGT